MLTNISLLLAFCFCLSVTCAYQNETASLPVSGEFLPNVVRQSALDKWKDAYKKNGCSLVISGASGTKPATKITATIKPACRKLGSRPFSKAIHGWNEFKKFAYEKKTGKKLSPGQAVPLLKPTPWARCHIIANQLGGRGNVYANLFPCWQTKFNTPVMSDCENVAAKELKAGNTVIYEATLQYSGKPWPSSITIEAEKINKNKKRSKLYKVKIENTEQAKLTNV